MTTELIICGLTLLCGFLGFIIQLKTERIKIIENQLSEKKYKAYSDLTEIFYELLRDVLNNKTENVDILKDRLVLIKKAIENTTELWR